MKTLANIIPQLKSAVVPAVLALTTALGMSAKADTAIFADRNTGATGWATHRTMKENALKLRAKRNCERDGGQDPRIVYFGGYKGFFAIAKSTDPLHVGLGLGRTQTSARNAAIRECRQAGATRVVVTDLWRGQ